MPSSRTRSGLAQAFLIGAEFLGTAPSTPDPGGQPVLHGHNLSRRPLLGRKRPAPRAPPIFGYQVANPSAYGVVEFEKDGRVLSLEEKPAKPRSAYAVPGIYFYDGDARRARCARRLKPSKRGELEITDLNRLYLDKGKLHAEILGRGTAWLDTGTHDSLMEAAQFVHVIENRQGLKIACLEEIAWRGGWIGDAKLRANIAKLGKSGYAQYLQRLLSAK